MVSHVRTHMAIKHLLGAKCAAKKSPSIKQKYFVFNIYFKVIKIITAQEIEGKIREANLIFVMRHSTMVKYRHTAHIHYIA